MSFSSYAILFVDPEWPRGWHLEVSQDGADATAVGTNDGRIKIDVDGRTTRTQPIRVTTSGALLFVLNVYDDSGATVFLGDLKTGLDASDDIREFRPTPPPLWPQSIDNPNARIACEAAMRARAQLYRAPRVREGRRLRTIAENVDKLVQSASLMEDAVARIRTGETKYRNTLQAELRASIVSRKGGNWTPSLFRVAAMLDEPLPVYAIVNSTKPPIDYALHLIDGPSISARFGTQSLVDLATASIRLAADIGGQELSAEQYIYELGSSDGGGHVDAAVPRWVDVLLGFRMGKVDALLKPLIEFAEVVIALTRHLCERSRVPGAGFVWALDGAYWTWIKVGKDPSTEGWVDARAAIDAAWKDRDLEKAGVLASTAQSKNEHWAELSAALDEARTRQRTMPAKGH